MTLEQAEATPLMGQTASWEFHGGKPLGVVPDTILRGARRWFADKLRTAPAGSAGAAAMREQLAAIDVVLKHREANSPQTSLELA